VLHARFGVWVLLINHLPRALFVCVHNAGRSQMAQAFWERLGGEGRSAGTEPSAHVHAEVVDSMREIGIDVAQHTPRALTTADAEWADVVVTMGCGDACPYIPGKRYVDWDLEDPAGKGAAAVREIRHQIEQRINALAEEGATSA